MKLHRYLTIVTLSASIFAVPTYPDGDDVQVGAFFSTVKTETELDPSTGALWAAQARSGSYDLNESSDSGQSWVGAFGSVVDGVDIDVTAVGGCAFTGSVSTDGVVRVVRFCSSGSTTTIIDVSAAGTPIEIAMASNADTFANRAYVAVLTDAGRIGVYWKDTVDDGPWTLLGGELSNALSGLALHYNDPQETDSPYLVLSYLKPDDRIFILGATSPSDTWSVLHSVDDVNSLFGKTRAAAYKDTLIVAYEHLAPIGGSFKRSIFYAISDDAGESWLELPLFVPADPLRAYTRFDVAARGNQGLIAVAVQNTSPVSVQVLRKDHYSSLPATWDFLGIVNDHSMLNAAPVTVSWIGDGFAVTYEATDGATYLDRVLGPLFADGFESGDTTAWSSSDP